MLTDEYDPLMIEALREQPPELPPVVVVVRNVMRGIVGAMMAEDRQRILDRAVDFIVAGCPL